MIFSKRTSAATVFAVFGLATAAAAATLQYADNSVSSGNTMQGGFPVTLKSTYYGYDTKGSYVTLRTSVYAQGISPNTSYACRVEEYDYSTGSTVWSSPQFSVTATDTIRTFSIYPLTPTRSIRVVAVSNQLNSTDNTVHGHIFEVYW